MEYSTSSGLISPRLMEVIHEEDESTAAKMSLLHFDIVGFALTGHFTHDFALLKSAFKKLQSRVECRSISRHVAMHQFEQLREKTDAVFMQHAGLIGEIESEMLSDLCLEINVLLHHINDSDPTNVSAASISNLQGHAISTSIAARHRNNSSSESQFKITSSVEYYSNPVVGGVGVGVGGGTHLRKKSPALSNNMYASLASSITEEEDEKRVDDYVESTKYPIEQLIESMEGSVRGIPSELSQEKPYINRPKVLTVRRNSFASFKESTTSIRKDSMFKDAASQETENTRCNTIDYPITLIVTPPLPPTAITLKDDKEHLIQSREEGVEEEETPQFRRDEHKIKAESNNSSFKPEPKTLHKHTRNIVNASTNQSQNVNYERGNQVEQCSVIEEGGVERERHDRVLIVGQDQEEGEEQARKNNKRQGEELLQQQQIQQSRDNLLEKNAALLVSKELQGIIERIRMLFHEKLLNDIEIDLVKMHGVIEKHRSSYARNRSVVAVIEEFMRANEKELKYYDDCCKQLAECVRLLEQKDGWKLEQDSGGFMIQYKMLPGSKMIALRVESNKVAIEVQTLIAILYEIDLYTKWVPFCSYGENLKTVDRACKVVHLKSSPPFISDRELFVHGMGVDRLHRDGSIFLMARSIDKDVALQNEIGITIPQQAQSKSVRVDIPFLTFQIKPIDRSNVTLSLLANFDAHLKFVPDSVINLVVRKFIKYLITRMLEQQKKFKGSQWEKNVHNNPEFYKWINDKIIHFLDEKLSNNNKK